MEKKIIIKGIMGDGYEQDNRVYGRKGTCPTLRAEKMLVNVIRKWKRK